MEVNPQIVGLEWLSPSPLALHLPLQAWDLILSELPVLCLSSSAISVFLSIFLVFEWKLLDSCLKENNFSLKGKREYQKVFVQWQYLIFVFWYPDMNLFCMGCPCLSSFLAKSWRLSATFYASPTSSSYPFYRSLGFQILLIFLVLQAHEKKSICPLGERVKDSPAA